MSLQIIQISVLGDNYSYLLRDDESDKTAVIDPAEADAIIKLLDENGWELGFVMNTHHHFDHVGGNLELKRATGCKVIGSEKEKELIPGIDICFSESDRFSLGNHQVTIIETPGHTKGHICYFVEGIQALFSGDHLFSLGCGRLFGGTAQQMWESLDKIRKLPAQTSIYCAHEYTENNGRFALTVEPGNEVLQQRIEEVARLRAGANSTIPSVLKQELHANPFLRPESPEIRQRLGKSAKSSNLEIFTILRQMKDRF